jgi:beta-lactamase superfamily II metal-dependent hydrolase
MEKVEIKIFQVQCGDCISIVYQNEDIIYSIVIDSGYSSTYHRTLKNEIKLLKEIDLFVITHTDDDHIGGMTSFITEYPTPPVKHFLYNFSPIDINVSPSNIDKKSVDQGVTLRDYLLEFSNINKESITIGYTSTIGDIINLKAISPSEKSLNRFVEKWEVWENKALAKTDYKTNIEDFKSQGFTKDSSPSNGSSIAFILEIKDFKILLLGDAHAHILVKGLKHWGYSSENKIKVNYVKLSHHGSEGNISQELIDMIECENYIISTDGSKSGLPNKKTLAKIVFSRNDLCTNFIHNYENDILSNIFTASEKGNYKIINSFPEKEENFYSIKHIFNE